MRNLLCLSLPLALAAGLANAATYTVNFDSPGYTADADPGFAGVDGWSQLPANNPPDPGPPVEYAPYAWIGASFSTGNAAAYGGFYDSLPDGFTLSRDFTGLVAGQKSLSFQNHITDSDLFGGRDTFGFTITDGGGDLLLTVNLVPASQDLGEEALWNVQYAFGSDSLALTGNARPANGVNFFSVDFGLTGLTFNYGGSSDNFSLSGTPAGYNASDTTLALDFTYDQIGDGDNFVRIDNINVVDAIPEPSAALFAGIGGLALVRRRRAR